MRRVDRRVTRRDRALRPLVVAGATLLAVAGLAVPSAAATETEQRVFTATADTYVDSSRPDAVLGASSGMDVDAKPARFSLLRFDLSGLEGVAVTSVRLRLRQVDASRTGGRVRPVAAADWSEATTWRTRPALGSTVLATFGAVQTGRAYDVPLDPSLLSSGVLSLGLDSTSSDGARWATRESAYAPLLLVTVSTGTTAPAGEVDGLSAVAAAERGSSEPTYYSANHRLAVTRGGRTLALHGLHSSGVQLTWRDPGGSWQTRSTGASATGAVLEGTGTGDWPASLAVGTDPAGAEHAWVVWSGPNVGGLRPVQLRRVTQLDSPDGPRLGPVVTVDAAPMGAYKADIALERGPDGVLRACVLYSVRVADTAYELTVAWLSDLTTDTPAVHDRTVLERSSSSSHYGSLVTVPDGLRAVTRAGSGGGSLRVYAHAAGAGLTTWSTGATAAAIPSGSSPNGAALSSGEVVAAVEDDLTAHTTAVYRFSASGTSAELLLRASGLAQPSVTTDGTRVWLVAVRHSDGALVSRTWSAADGWSVEDRVEVAAAEVGRLAWPSVLRQSDGRLRVLIEGPGSSSTRSSVWAFQRLLTA